MFQKLHLKLTALCSVITATIMITMSLCFLYVSESNLYQNQFSSFTHNIDTLASSMAQQDIITMDWLSKTELQTGYSLYLMDNGHLFLYNIIKGNSKDYPPLLEEALQESDKNAAANVSAHTEKQKEHIIYSHHTEYRYTSKIDNKDYFCSMIGINRDTSHLQAVILFSIDALKNQILQQRLLFLCIVLLTVVLLTVFAWLFTGKLLTPIIENRQMQSQFVASASHELRTPLAVILSNAECCKDACEEKREIFLANIKKEGAHMSRLINDMLTLSLSDSHALSLDKKETELDTLLLNSYEAFEPLAKEKGISLSVVLPRQICPPCPCDADNITQVVSILLHNAISYTPAGGKIILSLSMKKSIFLIKVEDNGIGIPDADKNKIFNRFYRAEKSRSTKEHFGLGLSIAYEIVKLHRGKITVNDAKGGGTLFTVELPSVS